jgi:hypothetical protein
MIGVDAIGLLPRSSGDFGPRSAWRTDQVIDEVDNGRALDHVTEDQRPVVLPTITTARYSLNEKLTAAAAGYVTSVTGSSISRGTRDTPDLPGAQGALRRRQLYPINQEEGPLERGCCRPVISPVRPL